MQNIKEYLSYDPLTGHFTWIFSKYNPYLINTLAGSLHGRGYIYIEYKGKQYKAHRLAWYFTYGYMPDMQIDHINEVKTDNRICNLRLADNSQNQQNISSIRVDNKSGYTGVSWHKGQKKWLARIRIKGVEKHLGYYDTPEEAHEVYLCAKRELHPFWVEKELA